MAEKNADDLMHQGGDINTFGDKSTLDADLQSRYELNITTLKEQILMLDTEKVKLMELLEQRNRKIELLEEDLRGGPMPYEMGREKKINELETRNGELKQQLWVSESELESIKNTVMELQMALQLAYEATAVAEKQTQDVLLTLATRVDNNQNDDGVVNVVNDSSTPTPIPQTSIITSEAELSAWQEVSNSVSAMFSGIGADESIEVLRSPVLESSEFSFTEQVRIYVILYSS